MVFQLITAQLRNAEISKLLAGYSSNQWQLLIIGMEIQMVAQSLSARA
jgi:hypothetical protein